jgi:hypothetical protein
MNGRTLTNILTPTESEIILLEGTTIRQTDDFPKKIKEIYFERTIDELVKLYGYEGDIVYIDVVCKLENETYVYYNRIDDWRLDTCTVKLVIGPTLNSILDYEHMPDNIKEEIIKKYCDNKERSPVTKKLKRK